MFVHLLSLVDGLSCMAHQITQDGAPHAIHRVPWDCARPLSCSWAPGEVLGPSLRSSGFSRNRFCTIKPPRPPFKEHSHCMWTAGLSMFHWTWTFDGSILPPFPLYRPSFPSFLKLCTFEGLQCSSCWYVVV